MNKIIEKIKKIDKNDILVSFFVAIFSIICIFIFINQYAIQYFVNGFSKLENCDLSVYYLDVGQATSSLIILPHNQVMIIDTGSQDSKDEFLESVNFILSRRNIKEIDYLILTHSDEDHVGGAMDLLETYQVYNVFRPKILSSSEPKDKNYKVVTTVVYSNVISAIYNEPNCDVKFIEDLSFMIGELRIDFYSCQNNLYSQTNAYSPFVLLTYKTKTFLFTGDATEERENEFVKILNDKNLKLEVDLLLVSHHGSKYSTTESFLNAINPRYAIISAGDVYHPSSEVLKRLENVGVEETYCTKTDGMIAVAISSNNKILITNQSINLEFGTIIVLGSCVFFMVIKMFSNSRLERYRKNDYIKLIKKVR